MYLDADLLRRLSVESGCALPTLTRYFADPGLVRGVSRVRIAKALRALGLDGPPVAAAPMAAITSGSPLVAAALAGKVTA